MTPSIEDIPGVTGRAAFMTDSGSVFKDHEDIKPMTIGGKYKIMPWGADNKMPYDILELIERDETMSTCLLWNAQMCYGSGLRYNCEGRASR